MWFAALLAVGCHDADPFAPVAGKPRRCEAPVELPGGVALPDALRSAIADAHVASGAPTDLGSVCNRLALEPGLFAGQHSLDSIDWHTWSPATSREAATLGRPLLVLSGFAFCDGCPDLTRQWLSQPSLIRDINSHFVPVLVDAHQRPDVDAYVMQAAQVLVGSAGWPVVAILQPDGRPFEASSWGAAASEESKSLPKIVEGVIRRTALGGGTIEEKAELTSEKMQRRISIDSSGPVPDAAEVATALRGYLSRSFHKETGSFGKPPLFPRAPAIDFLLQSWKRGDEGSREMVTGLLDRLPGSELADRSGGGFYRYTKGSNWSEPALEKQLADNAVIASVYLQALAQTDREAWRAAVRSALDFVMKELLLESGAFATSVQAQPSGSTARPAAGGEPRGLRDERVLADANAVAISALVRAGAVLGDPRYKRAALVAGDFLLQHLVRDGRVGHCVERDGSACADGYLPDQTLVALAFLDLDEAVGTTDPRWLAAARAIADHLPMDFEHSGGGGFFLTANNAEPMPLRYKPAVDAAVPSGNSAAALLYVRLAKRTGDSRYTELAQRTFEAFAEVLRYRPLTVPSMVVALVESSAPPQLDPAPAVQP